MKLIIRLRLDLSQVCEHKFKHSFQDCLNSFCTTGCGIETNTHFLLHYSIYAIERMTLLDKINNTNTSTLEQIDSIVTKDFLFRQKQSSGGVL